MTETNKYKFGMPDSSDKVSPEAFNENWKKADELLSDLSIKTLPAKVDDEDPEAHGTIRLYSSTGINEDGAMTQKAVSESLKDVNEKVQKNKSTLDTHDEALKSLDEKDKALEKKITDTAYSIVDGAAEDVNTLKKISDKLDDKTHHAVVDDESENPYGTTKLYSSTGEAVDGTMTQKAITDKMKAVSQQHEKDIGDMGKVIDAQKQEFRETKEGIDNVLASHNKGLEDLSTKIDDAKTALAEKDTQLAGSISALTDMAPEDSNTFKKVSDKIEANEKTLEAHSKAISDLDSATKTVASKAEDNASNITAETKRAKKAENDLQAGLTEVTNAVSKLNSGESAEGSVAYQIAQIVNENNNGKIDTLKEIADWIANDKSGAAKMSTDISTLKTTVGKKANDADISKAGKTGNYSDLKGLPSIPSKVSDLTNDSQFVNQTELNTAKADISKSIGDLSQLSTDEKSSLVKAINNVRSTAVSRLLSTFAYNVSKEYYSEKKSYEVGDYTSRGGYFYICTTPCSPGSWTNNSGCFEQTSIITEFANIVAGIGDLSQLTATNKNSLVAAMNEVRSSALSKLNRNYAYISSKGNYTSSKSYKVGDYVGYSNSLYRCIKDCSAGSWETNKNCFEVDTLTNAINSIIGSLGDLSKLATIDKTSLVAAINKSIQEIEDLKKNVADKVTTAVPELPDATSEVKGLAKLYSSTGDATDGSMTQAAIKAAISGFATTKYVDAKIKSSGSSSGSGSGSSLANIHDGSPNGSVTMGDGAIGDNAEFAVAEGKNTLASGNGSHAEGCYTKSSGESSHSEGSGAEAFDYNIYTETLYDASVSTGAYHQLESLSSKKKDDLLDTMADMYKNTVVNYSKTSRTEAGKENPTHTEASGIGSHAEGNFTLASGKYSHAEGGVGTNGDILYNLALNFPPSEIRESLEKETETVMTRIQEEYLEHLKSLNIDPDNVSEEDAEKYQKEMYRLIYAALGKEVYGKYASMYGVLTFTEANGDYSHAEGIGTIADGKAAHSEGSITKATGGYAHSEGSYSVASGCSAHAEGFYSEASGFASHAEGCSKCEGVYSHAEGESSAYGLGSHAEGCSTARGRLSHSEGNSNANGTGSHAEGFLTFAEGNHSHVEGYENRAYGYYSHVEGYQNRIHNRSTHAFGEYCQAPNLENDSEDKRGTYVEIVGNGTFQKNSNARTLDWNGNEVLAGKLTVGEAPENDMDVTTKKYVDDALKKVSSGESSGSSLKNITEDNSGNVTVTKKLTVGAEPENKMDVATKGYVDKYVKATSSGSGSVLINVSDGTPEGSVVMGSGTVDEKATFAVAEGEKTNAKGKGSHAEGNHSSASGNYSHAEGTYTNASGESSHSEGYISYAYGNYSHADGECIMVYGKATHSFGRYNSSPYKTANDYGPYVEIVGNGVDSSNRSNARTLDWNGNEWLAGKLTVGADPESKMDVATKGYVDTKLSSIKISADGTITSDENATPPITNVKDASAAGSVIMGTGTVSSTATNAVAEGKDTKANGEASHAEGNSTTASGNSSHAEGVNTKATYDASHAEGSNTKSTSGGSHAEGVYTDASGYGSHAECYFTNSSGYYSHAEGSSSKATGEASHAEGKDTISSADFSHAENLGTKASGENSHAEGNKSESSGISSHAEGELTLASGTNSHAEGNSTSAIGANSHAEGSSSKAEGNNSHAEGDQSYAIGECSHAEGNNAYVKGKYSHAEGSYNYVYGDNSHSEGENNEIHGAFSHVEGSANKAYGDYLHVFGRYADIPTEVNEDGTSMYLEVVGNGSEDGGPEDNMGDVEELYSNARTLDWSGNETLAGKLEASSIILRSSTPGSSKKFLITVDDSGQLITTAI